MTQPAAAFDAAPDTRVSAYYSLIGDPPHCGPGDHATALAYLHKIDEAIVQGGWTPYEANRLKKLKAKWSRRAFGHDPRFELVGTQTGRLSAEQEQGIRMKHARMKAMGEYATSPEDAERRFRVRGPQNQSRNPERRWPKVLVIDADLPTRKAQGAGSLDADHSYEEPESGELALPTLPAARQYLIPGQDTKGHANRVYCRVMPAHYRAICAVERSKQFGFRTVGDVIRWCIDYGVRELTQRSRLPQAKSAIAQVDAIREILLDAQYYQEFSSLFEEMTATVNRHIGAGAEIEAVRLIAMIRHQIEQMHEPYWQQKYLDELMRHYGQYLDGSRTGATAFAGDSA